MIDSGGYLLAFYEAAAAGWISPVFYAWAGSFYFTTPEIRPGFGYWFAALAPDLELCLTYLPVPLVASSAADHQPITAPSEPEGVMSVTLSCGNSMVSIGLSADAADAFDPLYDLPVPPPSPTGSPQALLLLADHPNGFGEYRQDVRGMEQEVTWTLRVNSTDDDRVAFSGIDALSALGYLLDVVSCDGGFDRTLCSDSDLTLSSGDYDLVAYRQGEEGDLLPRRHYLAANYPNPFNPSTTISFGLAAEAHVQLTVYNILGRQVATLIDEHRPAGHYEYVWDGRDRRSRPVSSGVYLYRLEAGEFNQTRKMMLIK
jgi:hypothetical protein